MSRLFGDVVTRYNFNYSSMNIQSWKLQQKTDYELPTVDINFVGLRNQDNGSVLRGTRGIMNPSTFIECAYNKTQHEILGIDYRAVVLNVSTQMVCETPAQVLNYHDIMMSSMPENLYFYDYKYSGFISVNGIIDEWDLETDDIENIYLKMDEYKSEFIPNIRYWCEPLFKMTSLTKNIDQQSSRYTLDASFEITIHVPDTIGLTSDISRTGIESIEITVSPNSFNTTIPIMIDMNNNIYSDNVGKISQSIALLEDDFDFENNLLKLPEFMKSLFSNKYIAIYANEDSTSSSPKQIFVDLGFSVDVDVIDGYINIEFTDTQKEFDIIKSFNFNNLTNLMLITFNPQEE
jgi:hypothetical protein